MPGFLKARVDDGNGFFARNLGFDPGATTTSFPNVIPATSSPTGSASTSSASALQTSMASNQSGGETKVHNSTSLYFLLKGIVDDLGMGVCR